jgi:hypothetical protein
MDLFGGQQWGAGTVVVIQTAYTSVTVTEAWDVSAKSLPFSQHSCRPLSVRGCSLALFVSIANLLLDSDANPRVFQANFAEEREQEEGNKNKNRIRGQDRVAGKRIDGEKLRHIFSVINVQAV